MHAEPLETPTAEAAYLFRHTLLRDAAYELQPPAERSKLHAIALQSMEDLAGGEPPHLDMLGARLDGAVPTHPSDVQALELAEHAKMAARGESAERMAGKHRLYLTRAAYTASQSYQNTLAAELWRRVAALHEGDERAVCLCRAGAAAQRSGDGRQGLRDLEQAVEIVQEGGSDRAKQAAYATLAVMQHVTGRMESAELNYHRALELAPSLEDAAGEARVHSNLACLYQNTGRFEEAEKAFRQAMQHHEDDGSEVCHTLVNLATLYREQGRNRESLELYRQALQAAAKAKNIRDEGLAYRGMVVSLEREDRLTEAAEACHQALERYRVNGDSTGKAAALATLGSVQRRQGQLEQAERNLGQAVRMLREAGDVYAEGVSMGMLSEVHRAAGRLAEAETAAYDAIKLHQAVGNLHSESICWVNLAMQYGESGRVTDADKSWTKGITIQHRLGNRVLEGRFRCSYVEALVKQGRDREAAAQWSKGKACLISAGAESELKQLRSTLSNICAKSGVSWTPE